MTYKVEMEIFIDGDDSPMSDDEMYEGLGSMLNTTAITVYNAKIISVEEG